MKPVILHIETSTNVCSVAVSEGSECLFFKMNDEGMNHAALLSVFIQEALESVHKKLDAVAVSAGPGSYTGLRIGVSTAKGLCYGFDIPLIAVDTLEVLAIPAIKQVCAGNAESLYCPMIDARRMEVYDAFYRADRSVFRGVSADIITERSYTEILETTPVYFFGNGAEKCRPVLTHPNAHFLNDIHPLVNNMIDIALPLFNESRFVDTAYFEPFYLKEFQATTPKNSVIG